jgi:hypothetical protein
MTMSEHDVGAPHDDDIPCEPDEILFDQAEFTAPVPGGPTCGFCGRPILDAYYEINGKVACAACRQGVEAAFRGGSRLARVIKATFLGSAAAVVGAALYYAFVRMTNINFGLVAVVLGLMVGGAVRKGSGNRGGRFYQLLAVFLTYAAIVGMQVAAVIEHGLVEKPGDAVPRHVDKPADKALAQPKAPVNGKGAPNPPNTDIPANPFADDPAQFAAEKVAVPKVAGAREAEPAPEQEMITPRFAYSVVLMVCILWAIPVIVAVHAPISGLIYGFALWEAWKMNRAVRLSFNGPFRVIAPRPSESDREVDDHAG